MNANETAATNQRIMYFPDDLSLDFLDIRNISYLR